MLPQTLILYLLCFYTGKLPAKVDVEYLPKYTALEQDAINMPTGAPRANFFAFVNGNITMFWACFFLRICYNTLHKKDKRIESV